MKSIFTKIVDAIETMDIQSKSIKEKCIKVCEAIFNNFCYNGGDFHLYKSFSNEFFKTIITSNGNRTEVLKLLKQSGILLCDESYNVNKGVGKGYKFNPDLINPDFEFKIINFKKVENGAVKNSGNFVFDPNNQLFNYSSQSISIINNFNISTISLLFPIFETYIKQGLQRTNFDEKVYEWIDNYEITREMIKVDSEIQDEYIDLKLGLDKSRYSLETALKFSKEQNLNLIQYKDNCYIDTVEEFLRRKTNDIKIIFKKSIFDLKNGIYRISRNETNRRLDYNLTNMKSNLLDFLRVDGEELVEFDISNAQFSMFNFIFKDNLDEDFSKLCATGQLYNFVSEKLNLTKEEAKKLMFRIAFDKVKVEQDQIRKLFSKTMVFIDSYKKEYGYKSFSQLLQNMESCIMIDGLFMSLIKQGYTVYPIHDAIRVKKSESEEVFKFISDYFTQIDFDCLLRNKKPKNKIKILYKGFKEIEIDEITEEDKKIFLEKVKFLETEYFGVSEEILINLKIFDKYKTSYMYEKLLKSEKWRKTSF